MSQVKHPTADRKPFSSRRLEREWQTVAAMIEIFCRGRHSLAAGLCSECTDLSAFVHLRLRKCPFQEDKPTCANCPIHCYKPEMRERIRAVMRYSGPRMLLRHPILALLHKLDGRKEAPELVRRRPTGRQRAGRAA